jgi:hypothetical protein
MVEPEFGLELLVLLFNRSALMRERDQRRHRRGRGRWTKKYFGAWRGPGVLFAQEPGLGRQASHVPVVRRRDADRREAGRPRAISAIALGAPAATH